MAVIANITPTSLIYALSEMIAIQFGELKVLSDIKCLLDKSENPQEYKLSVMQFVNLKREETQNRLIDLEDKTHALFEDKAH